MEDNKLNNKNILIIVFAIIGVFCLASIIFIFYIRSNDIKQSEEFEKCKNSCLPDKYSFDKESKTCACIKKEDELKEECSLLCNSDNFYINTDYDCVCNGGEKVFSNGSLIYYDSVEYEYEDNFNEWLNDVNGEEAFVTVIANSYCVRYQPIIHSLYKEYNFKLHLIHDDKLSMEDHNKLFSYEYEDYSGTPYTFIMKNGVVIDYISGSSSKENVREFLRRNNIIE